MEHNYQLSKERNNILRGLIGLGLLVGALGLIIDPARVWVSVLHNHFYWMSIGIGGLFFAALQWVTGAMWSTSIRRILEAFTAYLPWAIGTLVLVFFGMPDLYIWMHPEHVIGDPLLEGKSGYLSLTFFIIRNLGALVAWIFLARKMVGYSLEQDVTRDYALTLKNRFWTPVFLIVFALTFTASSFDQIMSLDPHWVSTIFGVYCFSGMMVATLAMLSCMTIFLHHTGKLRGFVNANHLHDIGKFLFGFIVFWAYIGFSQFLLIWYTNLPEETTYYIHRFHGAWFYVSLFLLIGKFILPFLYLLPRHRKRNVKSMLIISIYMLIAQWIDVLWMIQPEFYTEGPSLGWIELGITAGFFGLFFHALFSFFSKHNVVAIGDPRLEECLNHHQ